MNKNKLKKTLKDLIPHIKGKWFLADGGLLGLERSKDLLDHDNDLDIYLLPDTKIENLPEHLKLQEYYMESKVYDINNPIYKPNLWLEYVSFGRMKPINKGKNRGEILKNCSTTYKEERIIPKFTLPYIDVFHLIKNNDETYGIKFWPEIKYYKDEIEELDINNDLGFDIPVPKHRPRILERQYGKDWFIEDKNFMY
jgi:hypothetical protein